jgi:hypothetical protein
VPLIVVEAPAQIVEAVTLVPTDGNGNTLIAMVEV